jgi:signal transduction histidine kinase
MKSIYTRILLSTFGIFLFAVTSLILIVRATTYANLQTVLNSMVDQQFRETVDAYNSGGPASLSRYLRDELAAYPGTRRYLLDNRLHDLVSGENLSSLWNKATSRRKRFGVGSVLFARSSPDGKYLFIFVPASVPVVGPLMLLYAPVLAIVALLLWALAFQFASPLKQLLATMQRFGAGNLEARVGSKRRDETGDVARAFDDMAARIQTLLTAEHRLLQDISHELRSPLARLSFAAELARTSPDREMAAARLNKEIHRLTNLVESLLQVTQAEGDLSARKLEPVILDAILNEVVDDCALEANGRGCQLQLCGSTTVVLRGDRELLRRAVENIVRNAIRHAPSDSHIELRVDITEAKALLSIRDFGPGVPPEALANIFKPFYRVDEARDSSKGGIGLGLAIAQRAIRIHHGKIWAENANPGLRVFIDLPLETSVAVSNN